MLLGPVWMIPAPHATRWNPSGGGSQLMLGWAGGSPSKLAHTCVACVLAFGGYWAPLSTAPPSRWHPRLQGPHMASFPAGAPSILIDSSKTNSGGS